MYTTNGYEINVAKKQHPEDEYGAHFCRIALRQDVYKDEEAEKYLNFFRELFGDQYHVSMVHCEHTETYKKEWK